MIRNIPDINLDKQDLVIYDELDEANGSEVDMSIRYEDKIKRIIANELCYTSSGLGFNMLMARMKKRYGAAPSEAVMNECLTEIEAFANKFPAVIAKDYAELDKL